MSESAMQLNEAKPFPQGWRWVHLGELFDVQQGVAMSPKRRLGFSPYPFLRTLNVLWGSVDLSMLDEMDFTDEEVAKLSLKSGDLLVCEGGEVGRTAIWRGGLENCLHQNHIHRLRRLNDTVVPDFYMYWMQAAFQVFGSYRGQESKTTIPNLSGNRLKSFKVPLLPVEEQRRIAAKVKELIEELVHARTACEAQLEAAKAMSLAYLREVFESEEAKKWERKRLGEALELHDNGLWGFQDSVNGIPVIRSTNFQNNGHISIDDITRVQSNIQNIEDKKLQKGDILLERSGGGPKQPVGRVVLFDLEGEFYFGNFISRLRCKGDVESQFLLFYLFYLHMKGVTLTLQDQTTGIRNLRFGEYLQLPIPIPNIAAQQHIASELRNKMAYVEKLKAAIEKQLDTIKAVPQAILRKAFSGEL